MGWLRKSLCVTASVAITVGLVSIGIGASILAAQGDQVAMGVLIGIVACTMHDPVKHMLHTMMYSSQDRLLAQETIHMAMDDRADSDSQ